VEGEYKSQEKESQEIEEEFSEREEEMKAIKIVQGYSRDRRPDLKQFIIDTIVLPNSITGKNPQRQPL
jgi:transposase